MFALKNSHVKEYLAQYRYSSHAYMNRRRHLSALLSRCPDSVINPVHNTQRMKAIPVLHRPFNRKQLHDVLKLLSEAHQNLYLCALIMYGCLLRPHIEIRLLARNDFSENIDVISLSGEGSKEKRIRTVMQPGYVRTLLLARNIHNLPPEANIFTGNTDRYGYALPENYLRFEVVQRGKLSFMRFN